MAQIIDLFKSATKNPISNEIYGNDASRIESRGLVNIPRKAALLASSPNSVADLIGNQISGVLKGSANRPSDTIFKDNKPFSKPITILNGLPIGAKEANDRIEVGTEYYVKQSPSPDALFAKLKQGASSPLNVASNTAINALRNPTGALKTIKNLARGLKAQTADTNTYGEKFATTINGNVINETTKFSTHVPIYSDPNVQNIFQAVAATISNKPLQYEQTGLKKREADQSWDAVNTQILRYNTLNDTGKKAFETNYNNNKISHVTITPYGEPSKKIILPGTIAGISDDITPEWTNFRYVGSPFMQYRYVGVERSIKFDIKLYYTDFISYKSMRIALETLKSLVFPYEKLSTISYGNNDSSKVQALAFSPNLVHFSISGLYKNLFAYVEDLSIQIDDSTSWATMGTDMSGNTTTPFPTVINVSLGFKVIPDATIQKTADVSTYKVNFYEGVSPEVEAARQAAAAAALLENRQLQSRQDADMAADASSVKMKPLSEDNYVAAHRTNDSTVVVTNLFRNTNPILPPYKF